MKYAVIMGASSGIGFELTCRAVEDGYCPIMISKNTDNLEASSRAIHQLYGIEPIVYPCDLNDPSSLDEKLNSLWVNYEGIDTLIYSAGIGYGGMFSNNNFVNEISVVNVNVVSLIKCNHFFSKKFKEKGGGRILNLASLAGFQPGPYFANYYATKSYVINFSEALSVEMSSFGVSVTALCPGTTRTGFHKKAGIENTELAKGLFGIIMSSKKVSTIGYKGMKSGKVIVVPGIVNKIAACSVRFAPRSVVRIITRFINMDARGNEYCG